MAKGSKLPKAPRVHAKVHAAVRQAGFGTQIKNVGGFTSGVPRIAGLQTPPKGHPLY